MSLTKKYMENISVSIGFDGEINPLVIRYCEFLNELSDYICSDVSSSEKEQLLLHFLRGNTVKNDLVYRTSSHDIINTVIQKYDQVLLAEYDKIRSKYYG